MANTDLYAVYTPADHRPVVVEATSRSAAVIVVAALCEGRDPRGYKATSEDRYAEISTYGGDYRCYGTADQRASR